MFFREACIIIWLKFLFFSIFFISFSSYGKEKIYHLTVKNKTVHFAGKEVKHALAINDRIPAPTLKFKKGDKAVIHVTNKTNEPTTIHWHGILVPWNMDGPAFSNNKLIQAGETFVFRFPIKHTGTYWYHSHTGFQEQRGLYGAIVIEDDRSRFPMDHDRVLVLSDWTNEHPKQVLNNLKKEGEYYSYKKKFFPSVIDAISQSSFIDFLKGEWSGMGVMDLSDVGYDAFLINGKQKLHFSKIRSGDRVRLRVINAGASTHFYLNLGKNRFFKVISKDGVDVQAVKVNEVFMGMGETYDLLFTMPKVDGGLEFRATASDITGYGRLIFGNDHHYESVPDFVKPNPYKMDHGMDHEGGKHKMKHGKKQHSKKSHNESKEVHGHSQNKDHNKVHGGVQRSKEDSIKSKGSHKHSKKDHDHSKKLIHHEMSKKEKFSQKTQNDFKKIRLDYKMLKSVKKTNYNSKKPRRDIDLKLSGSMSSYTWSLNGKTFTEDKYIMVREGEVVRFHFENGTMMTHPMHLHGHFFRVLNGRGDHSPLFHTVDVRPFEKITIEVYMNEPGIWMFHCHNLYHMKMGMARLIKYENFKRPKSLIEHEKEFSGDFKKDSDLFWKTKAFLYTNLSEMKVSARKGSNQFKLKLKMKEYDFDTFKIETKMVRKFKRKKTFYLIGGAFYEGKKWKGVLGGSYKLPLLLDFEALLKIDKKREMELEIEFEKEIPLWSRLNLEMEYEFEMELSDRHSKHKVEAFLDYQFHDRLKVGTYYKLEYKANHDLDHSIGIGLGMLF